MSGRCLIEQGIHYIAYYHSTIKFSLIPIDLN